MEINPIYKFMKDNGLTQKDEATFVSEYSNPQKSAELHKFMVDNGLTTKGADDFYNEYFAGSKKKEPTTTDSSQPAKPSTPSFGQKVVNEALTQEVQIPLRGQQKPPVQKKPYQDIYYKPEALPSETTQMPETPVIKAAKKDFKESQLKPQVQLKATPQELEEIEKKTEKADKIGLALNEYQSTADDVNSLEKLKRSNVNEFYQNLKDARPDLYEKYSGRTIDEGRSLEGDARGYKKDRDVVYANYLSDLLRADDTHKRTINRITPIINATVDEKVNSENYKRLTTQHSLELGGDVVDMSKVDDEAVAIAEKYNLPTDGEAWRLLKNKIKANTDFQIIKPQAEEIFKSKYPELQAKRQKMFDEGFKYDDEIYSRVDAELTSLQNQYEADAKNEFNAMDADYKSRASVLNQQYNDFIASAKQVESNLDNLYKTGQIDQLTYEKRWSDLQDEKKSYYDIYQQDYPTLDEYVKKSNEINSKYNRKFELQKKALTDKAHAQIKAEFDKYSASYKEDPAVLEELNKAYRESYELASDIRSKKMGLGAELSNAPMSKLYHSTLSSLGGVFKGWGGSLDSKTLELLGESMEQNFMMPSARTEEFKDWVDPQNLQLLTGQLLGSMAPSMAITAAVASATGGQGIPAIIPMVAGGLAGWGAETVDIVGRSYLDMFEKSGGDITRSSKAAESSLKSQYDLMFTYAFDALPFVGKALRGIPTKVGRIAVGAGIEMGTEFLQEYPQNIAEENIQKGLDPWTNLGEAIQDTKKMKQTLISIGPVAILGGAGQLGSKSAKQEAIDTYVAMQQKSALAASLPDQKRQYIQGMVFDRGGKFARGVVGALFADGTIDEETSKDLLVEVERSEKIQDAGKEAGLKGSKLNIYGFYSARAEEAERNAAKFGHDPILFESYKQQAKAYRDAGLDFMKGNNPDLLTVTYADGSQAIMTPEDVNGLFSNPIALTLLNRKKISVEAYRENGEGGKALQELSERAKAYKENKRYVAPTKRGTSLEYWQGLAKRRIQQLNTQQPELSEEERLAAIKKIEDEANASFEAQLEQEKQQKRDQRDVEIEQLQQQREALGVNEIDAFFSDMKPLVATMVERMESGQAAPKSAVKAASDYLYAKYKELTAMKSDPNRMLTIAQIESIQAQIEQDLQTLEGNPPSQKTETNDQENIQGVSGQVGVGQEPVAAQPVEGAGTETTEAGGVLQAPEEEVTEEGVSRLGIIAADYLFTGGQGVMLSSDYLIQALSGAFRNAGGAIEKIRKKYAPQIMAANLGDLKNFVGTDLYNSMMAEIRDAINSSYTNNTEANQIFDDVLRYPTGFPNREGNRVSTALENLNESEESSKTEEVAPKNVPQKQEELTPPTEDQILDDLKNKRFATFTYKSESEVPNNLKSKISSTGEINGKPFVKVTLTQSEADYQLAKTQEKVTPEAAPEVVVKPSRRERLAKMFETSEGEIAAEKVASFLGEANIGVEVLDAKSFEETGKQRNFEGDADGIFLVDNNTGKIYLNKERIKGAEGKTIAFHEGIHPVVNIIRNTNPKLYSAIVDGLKAEGAKNAAVAQAAADVAASEYYQEQGPSAIEDETVVETMARVAAGDIDIDTFEPSFREKFIEFMNKLAKMLGLKPIAVNSPRMEVKRLADQLSKALNEGGKLSDIVGKENIGKFQNTIESLKNPSSPLNAPTALVQPRKGIYGKKIKYKAGGYDLSLVKPEDIIDIEALVKKIADEKAVVWFWTADQLGRGMYSDETIEGEHYLDAGPSFALDEENRAEGVIWASGADEKTLKNRIQESDYIFIISGSPQQSKLFNKKVIEFLRKRTEKASGLNWNDFSKKVIDLTTKTTKAGKVTEIAVTQLLKKYNSFEELLNSKGNDKKKLFVELEKQRTTTNTPLSQYLKSIGLSFDVDTLRDGFYKENGFDINDVMLVLKPTSLGGKSNHSTYEYNIMGTVVGVPDKRVNGIDLLPEERRKKYSEAQRSVPMTGAAGSMKSKIQASKMERTKPVGKYEPLPGAPTPQGATGPIKELVDVAESYAKKFGVPYTRQGEYVPAKEEFGIRLADAYKSMKHDPKNPKVKEAYDDLIRQTTDQYNALMDAGYEFTFFDSKTDPYKGNPMDAMRDLRANKKMAVYGTYDGYGTEGITGANIEDNPMLAPTGLQWPDQSGKMHDVTANDLFRAVHDAFGHGLEGAGFRARGEENAWQAHARLFTGPAVAAITSETRGQNSWLNFNTDLLRKAIGDEKAKALHPNNWQTITVGQHNRTAKLDDTIFAEQKIGLLPEWAWTENVAPAMPSDEGRTEPVMIENAPEGTYLNIGLKEGMTNKMIPIKTVLSKLPKDVQVIESTSTQGTEPTAAIKISRKLTDEEMDKLLEDTKQLAIPQLSDGEGVIHGTKDWGDFNPDFFVLPNGKKLSDVGAKKGQPSMVKRNALDKRIDEAIDRKKYFVANDMGGVDVYTPENYIKVLQEFVDTGAISGKAAPYTQLTERQFPLEYINGISLLRLTDNDRSFVQDEIDYVKSKMAKGQPSMVKRTSAEVQRLMEDSMDSVDEAIADGVDAQTAVEDNITSQDWYSELTPKQKEQFDEIIKDEFGVTPKAPVAKPTGVKATIANIIDNYYKLKDGDRSARAAINEILGQDPKLKYIYDNISKINKQLQDAGVITDKTDGCP